MEFTEKYHESLYSCNKPYQYTGGEFLSFNKSFDEAKVRFAFAFPDKYEIGISNLGQRILYSIVNEQKNYMADRVYAPEKDFQPEILYGLESKKAIKDFDAVGFSIQYELSYPTILKMMEMSDIPYKNSDRYETSPIIIAGGPCTFNPLPMKDFIDCFVVGDGEEVILEICKILEDYKTLSREEKIKKIAELEGVWCSKYPEKVTKRIVQLTYDNALKKYPVPFSTSVHDRAITEIRRGCTRMCRFCQPGHVTLPVRERKAEDIIKITKELVENTGYNEYSLLSLSSNDYTNINEVIKELNCEFKDKKVSVSLPSQRIDGFNLELANLTQEVRKAAMTLAPEAGSQRLRNVIKKNITREQIIDVALELYKNGWSKIKFYFIAGLPTETLEDMEEMAKLLGTIRWKQKVLKKELGLKHSLDITCTLSVFVPKPHTPFQWVPQMPIDKILEHIHYLKDCLKTVKGVKINYHEPFISQIEAILTRGDENLGKYIEALYKKGCYLDAWGEYFNKDIWKNTAVDLGINLEELSTKQYSLDEELPWDFVNTGLDKSWLIEDYKKAFDENISSDFTPTCEQHCVNCGVCKNLKVKKIYDEKYKAKEIITKKKEVNRDTIYRYRLKVTKHGNLRYFSHLDFQNVFIKSINRTNFDMAFTCGFNPTMKLSMGVALPLFVESDCELIDFECYNELSEEDIKTELSQYLPDGCEIKEAYRIEKTSNSIDTTVSWAEYEVKLFKNDNCNLKSFMYNCDRVLSSPEILMEKKNKKGLIKTLNIKPSVKSYRFEGEKLFIILKTGQQSEIPPVRADVLMNLIDEKLIFDIKRIRFLDDNLEEV